MTIEVKVKCFNGKSYDVPVDPESESVAGFQQKISELSGITPERQTILFKGKVLSESGTIKDYDFSEGVTISVVRRVGKAAPKAEAPKSVPAKTPPPASKNKSATPPPAAPQSNELPPLEEMMRNLQMPGGAPPGGDPMANLASLFGGGGLGGGGLGGGAGAGPANMDKLFSSLPGMMNGLLGPLLQEYLANPEKQEKSREAILENPMLKTLCESDPEMAKVLNDPEKWKASMAAANKMFENAGSLDKTEQTREVPAAAAAAASTAAAGGPSSAADSAPPGVNVVKLSESYGHALGQSLVNSGLGLDPELVVRGLRSAVKGDKFPMPLPEYERSMAQLQSIAQDYLTKTNLDHANNLFKEIEQDPNAVILEKGKIAFEKGDSPPETSKPAAKSGANVLVILTARLLDGRHFFTCPAADDTGESVHPLTLALDTAPRALAKGITGMHEGETRLLYVHPSACEGMAEMFGDLLPPNALLIFDLQLLNADAPEEESSTIEELTNKSSL